MMRPVLKAAEYSYTAGKCSPSLRELAVRGECSVMRQTYRNGLLAAVRRRLGFFHTPDDLQGLLRRLLDVAGQAHAADFRFELV
jgi:hypothetical protein